jgi:hypothetical protein
MRQSGMRTIVMTIVFAGMTLPLFAQQPPRMRPNPQAARRAAGAEAAVKEAMEQLVAEKKVYERDVEVLARLRAAEQALLDEMQPNVSIQKAWDEVQASKRNGADFLVMQGIVRAERELEGARRSPNTADFGRLRGILRGEAIGPATRVVVAHALRLEDEALAWIKVQELISAHLRSLSEIAGESLRASQR